MIRLQKYFPLLLLVFLLSTPVVGQQNLFNIPSGDITPQNKIFYQHQFNLYEAKLESKGHFVYGLGSGWDAGINLVGKGVYFSPEWRTKYNSNPANGALYPILMATVQKQFSLSDRLKVNLGAQAGHNLSNRLENKELNYFTYGMGSYYWKGGKSRVVAGIYHANQMFVGDGNTVGIMLGYEINLSKRWYLMGDWLSGNNDSSVGVIGGMYNVSKRVQLCAGALIPNPDTPKPMGIVLEINILTWDAF